MIVLGAAFNRGQYQAVGPFKERIFGPAISDSLDGQLSRLDLPILVLDLRSAPQNIRQDLNGEKKVRANVGSGDDGYDVYTPTESFDAIYFVDEVTRTRPNPSALEAWRKRN